MVDGFGVVDEVMEGSNEGRNNSSIELTLLASERGGRVGNEVSVHGVSVGAVALVAFIVPLNSAAYESEQVEARVGVSDLRREFLLLLLGKGHGGIGLLWVCYDDKIHYGSSCLDGRLLLRWRSLARAGFLLRWSLGGHLHRIILFLFYYYRELAENVSLIG